MDRFECEVVILRWRITLFMSSIWFRSNFARKDFWTDSEDMASTAGGEDDEFDELGDEVASEESGKEEKASHEEL